MTCNIGRTSSLSAPHTLSLSTYRLQRYYLTTMKPPLIVRALSTPTTFLFRLLFHAHAELCLTIVVRQVGRTFRYAPFSLSFMRMQLCHYIC